MTKIALVTGAGSGIGRATAQLLADRGFGVITTYHRNPADHVPLPLDVADTSSFPAFADRVRSALEAHWQRDTFDYLVNNAGIGGPSPFTDTTDEAYERYHRTLLKGPFFLTQALLPLLSDQGAIVNVGSSSTRPGVTTPGYAAYGDEGRHGHAHPLPGEGARADPRERGVAGLGEDAVLGPDCGPRAAREHVHRNARQDSHAADWHG